MLGEFPSELDDANLASVWVSVGKGWISLVRLPLLLIKELRVLLFVLVGAPSLKMEGLTTFFRLVGVFWSSPDSGIEKSKVESSRYGKESIEAPKLTHSAEVEGSGGDVGNMLARKSGQSWPGRGVVGAEVWDEVKSVLVMEPRAE
jgi:hypothetical protein